MKKIRALGGLAVLCLAFFECAPRAGKPLIDPSTLRFPFAEEWAFEVEGSIAGQPRARDGILYFATTDGSLTSLVVPARQIFWRFRADRGVSSAPEPGEGGILLRDDGNALYVLDARGSLVFKMQLAEAPTSAVRESRGRIFFGTGKGGIQALDVTSPGGPIWDYRAAAAAVSGPVFYGDLAIFGCADGRLLALDREGRLAWEFAAKGAIRVDPVVAAGRVYFGTEDRFFYGLDATTGRKKWSRRLQGVLLHPAVVQGRSVAVVASNSVVTFLSRRGGSILAWQPIPSRVIHPAAPAGGLVLVSSDAPSLAAYDSATGNQVGGLPASGLLVAGALWIPPFVVAVEEAADSGRQRVVVFTPRAQPAVLKAKAG